MPYQHYLSLHRDELKVDRSPMKIRHRAEDAATAPEHTHRLHILDTPHATAQGKGAAATLAEYADAVQRECGTGNGAVTKVWVPACEALGTYCPRLLPRILTAHTVIEYNRRQVYCGLSTSCMAQSYQI